MQLDLPFVTAADFYFVRHCRARRYLLRVDGDGRVRVTIPRGGSRREADLFAQKNLAWIEQQRARIVPARLTPAQRQAARLRADAELPGLLRAKASELGLIVSRVSIRNQRSRWGSCGPGGHITLNWRLVLMPDRVRDYVIVHELMHLTRMDHSPAYWKLVEAVYPDYRSARTWLRAEGLALR